MLTTRVLVSKTGMAYTVKKGDKVLAPDPKEFYANFPGIFTLRRSDYDQLYLKYRMRPPAETFTIVRPQKRR